MSTSLGDRIINLIQDRAQRKRINTPGSVGEFYRAGGKALLFNDLPLTKDDWVIDAGGYRGEWTTGIQIRYGCHSEIFEPIPDFAAHCRDLYKHNSRVRVQQAALGGTSRNTKFSLSDNGTTEFMDTSRNRIVEAKVQSVKDVIDNLDADSIIPPGSGAIGLLKLNIEGGEYEVLESLLENKMINRIRCMLIQFHRQPEDWETRYTKIVDGLRRTHSQRWCYPMVWEKWLLR